MPFVLETLGAFGKAAQKIVGMLATGAHYVPQQFRGPTGFRLHLVSALSITLQRGNAMVMFEGSNRATQHAHRTTWEKGKRLGAAGRRHIAAALQSVL